jgi:hypothetical protein
MWKGTGLFLAALSALSAQSISELALDPKKVVDLPVCKRPLGCLVFE